MINYGIILASGTGTRYKSDIPKQFIKIAGKTVLEQITQWWKYKKRKFIYRNNLY